MTANELIENLKQISPDTHVIIRGYEDGYNNILRLIPRIIIPHPEQKAYYYGEYTEALTEKEKNLAVKAVELYGENTKAED
jgi:hypothetical protein